MRASARALWSYFGLAFLFTWSLLPMAAGSIVASLVALLGPAVAAFAVTAFGDRRERPRFRRRLFAWRVSPR